MVDSDGSAGSGRGGGYLGEGLLGRTALRHQAREGFSRIVFVQNALRSAPSYEEVIAKLRLRSRLRPTKTDAFRTRHTLGRAWEGLLV